MIIRPQGNFSEAVSSEAFEHWIKSAVGRHVDDGQRLWSVRHVGRTSYAFEVEFESDAAHLWLSSTDDEVTGIEWRQRPRPETRPEDILIDAYLRIEDAGMNIACMSEELVTELDANSSRAVREAFERGVPQSIIPCLRELAALGEALGKQGEASERAMYPFVKEEATTDRRRDESYLDDSEPKPPRQLPDELREASPAEQDVYELMVEGTIPAIADSDDIRPGPLCTWSRHRELVRATYGDFGHRRRSVGFSGTYAVARYADGRRCVVQTGGFEEILNGGGRLSYWVDFLEWQSRRLVSAIADAEQAIPPCAVLPPDEQAARLAAIPRQRSSALKALYDLSPRLLDATECEHRPHPTSWARL